MTNPSNTPDGPHGTDLNADPSGSDDDSAMHSLGEANAQAGSGVEGLGGNRGGTPDAAGLGTPGGAQQRAVGPAPAPDLPTSGSTTPADPGAFRDPGHAVADNHQAQQDDAPITYGDPTPYLAANAPAARHTDGSLSVAGGSGGSAIGSADDLELPTFPTPTADDDDAPKR